MLQEVRHPVDVGVRLQRLMMIREGLRLLTGFKLFSPSHSPPATTVGIGTTLTLSRMPVATTLGAKMELKASLEKSRLFRQLQGNGEC